MISPDYSSEEFSTRLLQRVTEYLTTEGWRVGGAKPLQGVRWMVEANDDKGRPIIVFKESTALKQSERILIGTSLVLSPEHKERYAALNQVEQRDLVYDLRQQIILLEVGYGGFNIPLERMIFEDVVYVDDLSKSTFLKSVRKVRNAMLLAVTIISRRFNEPPPPEPPRPTLGFHPSR